MSVSRLPHEVLVNIAFYLPIECCSETALVCRAWTVPFMEKAWSIIQISTEKKAKALYNLLLNEKSLVHSHVDDVKSIIINGDVILPENVFLSLQDNFQSVVYLQITSSTFQNYCTYPYHNWKKWKSLTILYLHVLSDIFGIEDIVPVLSYLPNIAELNLGNSHDLSQYSMRWTHLDLLQEQLPKLDTLILYLDLEPIDTTDFETISSGPVHPRLISFSYYGKPFSMTWLYYWAKRYPQLCELYSICRPVEIPKVETTISVLQAMLKLKDPLNHLETAFFRSNPRGGIIDPSFLQILFLNTNHLMDVNCLVSTRDEDSSNTTSVLKALMRSYKSLLRLTLEIKEYSSYPTSIINSFKICPSLVVLDIKSRGTVFKLDQILNYFPVLVTMKLNIKKLCLSQSANKLPPSHSLRNFEIQNADFDFSLFSYLSRRCYFIDTFFMSQVLITESPYLWHGYIFIDMPFSSFTSIKFDRVYVRGVKGPINNMKNVLLSITQLYDQHCRIDLLPDLKAKIKGTILFKGYIEENTDSDIRWENIADKDSSEFLANFESIEAGNKIPLRQFKPKGWFEILTCVSDCEDTLDIEVIPLNYIKIRCEVIESFDLTYKSSI
ncbi:hypothetical protein J3Q64DRAFT_1878228 [Phycomyces blakesleeanus]|uniref:F-box domain-containing protein n=2 Tax=Phycomyces blakesleeanus TaxID=4837 RepID=A0A167LZ36_PHYB8|nr:hypothetical protein PHYBLDRAFT_170753 [Phycomyces blakesleeanus NRRL 1555(-)]OAD71388.1 hypothetical protein PHYBLDRAFT_170753 [Phycomyces blakesleeanus NRRL 1555(-)]|eukprot:XP_018289428.1 hypothetical protein PHYBLDRAFT_170753 [Phycomyces blakesleeanus NRRL 1555(-)]